MKTTMYSSERSPGEKRDRAVNNQPDFQLEAIFKGFIDGITVHNLAGELIFANDAAARLFGYPSAIAMVEWSKAGAQAIEFELFDEQGVSVPLSMLSGWRALTEGKNGERILRIRRPEVSEDCWLLIKSAPILESDGKPGLTLNLIEDISARIKTEEERFRLMLMIEQQRRRIQTILDNVPGIVWESRRNPERGKHEIVFVSNYAQQMLGYPVDEWLTSPNFWERVVYPDDLHNTIDRMSAVYSGDSGKIELRFIAKDGRVVPVEMYMTIVTDEAGQPAGLCGVFMDISKRKQVEASLARYALNLERSNEELKEFAYVASHDLQEPLRMIASYLQLIEERYTEKLDDEGREFIGFAVDGAARMKELINGLLSYSRVETQAKNFNFVDSQKALEQACKLLETTISEAEATVTSDPLPQIWADEHLIIQLFQNLIGNAIKYRSERKPEIHVGVTRERNHWVFSVQDNGIGIEAAYLERIFVIFQRLHDRGKYPGTGLGLAICKKVVERHGGRIWAESEIGKGTTICFTIPT